MTIMDFSSDIMVSHDVFRPGRSRQLLDTAMTPLAKRRAIVAVLLVLFCAVLWYATQPRVPKGQPPLVTLNAASVAELRDAFNRDVDYVRIIVLPSPT